MVKTQKLFFDDNPWLFTSLNTVWTLTHQVLADQHVENKNKMEQRLEPRRYASEAITSLDTVRTSAHQVLADQDVEEAKQRLGTRRSDILLLRMKGRKHVSFKVKIAWCERLG